MTWFTKLIVEAERESVVEFVHELKRDAGLQAILREKGFEAAMPVVTTRPAGSRVRPNGPGEAGPVRVGGGASPTRAVGSARAGSSTHPRATGEPISHNSTPGRPDVTVVGRARPSTMAHPIRSAKSKIVPEPDQIQSPPPGPRRRSLLEPPGY
jgi:hypothetical protein